MVYCRRMPVGVDLTLRTLRITLSLLCALLVVVSFASCGGEGEEEGSATMSPGSNCLDCHEFTAAGTVFNRGDAPASGGVSGATVTFTDSSSPSPRVVSLVTNAVGNFYTSAPLAMPFQVQISYQGNVATMADASSGACSGCHSPGTMIHPSRVHVGVCADCH